MAATFNDREARRQAHNRMSYQIPDDRKIPMSDFALHNAGSLASLQAQVDDLWPILEAEAAAR
jgi:dephospho-CoA kinase